MSRGGVFNEEDVEVGGKNNNDGDDDSLLFEFILVGDDGLIDRLIITMLHDLSYATRFIITIIHIIIIMMMRI